MKLKRNLFLAACVTLVFAVQGCKDGRTVVDNSVAIDNHNWSYSNRVKFDVKIEDVSVPYNLYLNLRVGGGYRYSNIYTLFYQSSPDKKLSKLRYEFTLANPDGEWLGSGSGNLYSYQMPLHKAYKFAVPGIYHFEIEQNMRDNPLHEVSDVGLKVEKAK